LNDSFRASYKDQSLPTLSLKKSADSFDETRKSFSDLNDADNSEESGELSSTLGFTMSSSYSTSWLNVSQKVSLKNALDQLKVSFYSSLRCFENVLFAARTIWWSVHWFEFKLDSWDIL
jgi:hypothetical protein